MANRPSRSSSIPIPRSNTSTSPTRNIESVISIPFTSTGRPRIPSYQSSSARGNVGSEGEHRGIGLSHVALGGSSSPMDFVPNMSPVRLTGRSVTQPVPIYGRNSPRSSNFSFEPRVVRAESSRSYDQSYVHPVATSRRPSISLTRTPSIQKPSLPPVQSWQTPQAPIPRPSYLEHSALRHLLQTEPPSSIPTSGKPDVQMAESSSRSRSVSTDSDDDSNNSPPPRDIPPSTSAGSPDKILSLPTRWCETFKHHILTLSEDGRELSFQGVGNGSDREAAAARTIQPIPPACGIYYYEVDIRSKGIKAHISVGFAGRDVKTSRLPGWEPNSWGYHGDDGCSFAAEKNGSQYGPTFGVGDVIGCGIDFSTNRAFYTKNGALIRSVFENVGKGIDIFPSVGLQHQGESVKANFGHEPFKFDIDQYVQQQRNRAWNDLMQRPIDSSILLRLDSSSETGEHAVVSGPSSEQQTKEALHKLVLSYLAHHGYAKTARAFQKQRSDAPTVSTSSGLELDVYMDGTSSSVTPSSSSLGFEADIELRTRIVNFVLTKDIDSALEETRKHYPFVLDSEDGLILFKLRCRKFIELILEAAELKKKKDALCAKDAIAEEDGMGMDVDDENIVNVSDTLKKDHSFSATTAHYDAALNEAISYGQGLQVDYKSDSRPEVQTIFRQTFSIVAYEDPLSVGGSVTEVASHEARVRLANELNQAILKSQGRPADPALETIYRSTAVCLLQLGLLGVGLAAFADIHKELLEA